MVDFVRKLVSGNRRRFEDEAQDINLDLTYITSRIIAMSYPSDGLEGYYRNPIEKVSMILKKFRCPNF
jgi:phosphatidylinositol-3,4,5-trisphosphate 3-phosphatase/dual-specificity protein phosphatase PTEN